MPPAKNGTGVGRLRFAGCVFCLVGRAFTPAEPIKFLKFFNVRRGQGPALQTGGNGQRTGNPARRVPLPGGMYASPTNTRYRVHKPQKRCHAANAHGPHACGPYRPAGNSRRMGKAGVYRVPSTAGSRPRPTERRERAVFPGTPRGEHPCREACMPPLQTPGTAYANQKRCHRADVRAGDGRCNGAGGTVVYRTEAFCTGRGFAPR